MKKRYRYRLPLSEDAVDGLGSVLMAAISGIFLLAAAVISFVLAGKAGTYVGIFGLMGILLSVIGFITGLISFGEKRKIIDSVRPDRWQTVCWRCFGWLCF